MKIPAIKALVENNTTTELKAAEEALYEEKSLEIEVLGDDVGEQLTHILAAQFIQAQMAEEGSDLKTALRAYTLKVRNSIN